MTFCSIAIAGGMPRMKSHELITRDAHVNILQIIDACTLDFYVFLTHLIILDTFQDKQQMIPYHLYGGDKQTLVGRMNITECRTE